MISPTMHILRSLWNLRIASFWPIWITTTSTAATSVAWVVMRWKTPSLGQLKSVSDNNPLRLSGTPSRGTSVGLFVPLALLAGLIAVSFAVENFAYFDDIQLTVFSLKGHDLPPPIWPASGRFFPLGLQEFNILHHFTKTLAGFHGFLVFQLLILFGVLLVLDDELSITARAMLIPITLSAPALIISFTGLIYPERDVVLCLACLVLAVQRFERTRSPVSAAAAVVCAQIMLYEKETASLMLLAFALGRPLLRWSRDEQAASTYRLHWTKETFLDLCLASLSILFLLYRLAALFPHSNMKYVDDTRLPPADVLLSYLKLDLLSWIFVAVFFVRTSRLFRRTATPSPLWDGLAFGGIVCFGAYIYLGIFRAYYLAPVDFIAALYLGRLALLSWKQMRLWPRVATAGCLCIVLIQFGSLSAVRLIERHNLMRAKAAIADLVIRRHYSGGRPIRLFFPTAAPWQVMEFGYFLSLRGIPVEESDAPESIKLDRVVLRAKSLTKDGRCEPYWSLICHAALEPASGDLVIVLPDDRAGLSEVTPYRKGGDSLLFCQGSPAVPSWLYPYVKRLSVASVSFLHYEIPDRWLDASVTLWK